MWAVRCTLALRSMWAVRCTLAPNAKHRDKIVPSPKTSDNEQSSDNESPASFKYRLSFAALLARVFQIQIETCPSCGVRRRASRFGEIFDFERPRSRRSLGVGEPPRRRTFFRGSKTLSCARTASARIRLRILKNFSSEKRLVQSQRTSAFFRRKNTLLEAFFNLRNPI